MKRYEETLLIHDKCIELNPKFFNSYLEKGIINNYNQGISLDNLEKVSWFIIKPYLKSKKGITDRLAFEYQKKCHYFIKKEIVYHLQFNL